MDMYVIICDQNVIILSFLKNNQSDRYELYYEPISHIKGVCSIVLS